MVLFSDDIMVKFEGPEGYKHEKFTWALLDSLVMEAAARLSVIMGLKCRGIDQGTVEAKAYSYIKKIENRLDKEWMEYSVRNL